jgi:hypothetical protein
LLRGAGHKRWVLGGAIGLLVMVEQGGSSRICSMRCQAAGRPENTGLFFFCLFERQFGGIVATPATTADEATVDVPSFCPVQVWHI